MTAALDLFWIPLGSGGHCVRLNGRAYETVVALVERRAMCDLYHAALVAELPEGRTTIEVGPVWDRVGGRAEHGAVVSGPVGLRSLGRWAWFRYEVRCWPNGVIPDLADAVDSPQRVTTDEDVVRRALAHVADVPALTWGRDELHLGEMWNSNSVIAWTLVRAGVDVATIGPPARGRAPGFGAGVAAAALRSRGAGGHALGRGNSRV